MRINMMPLCSVTVFLCLFLWACGGRNAPDRAAQENPVRDTETPLPGIDAPLMEARPFSPYLPGADDSSYARYREEAARIASSLDGRVLAAQVLLVGMDNKNYLSGEMKNILMALPPGGIMFFKYNLNVEKDKVRSFLTECSELTVSVSGITPFLAADHEGGAVHRFGPGVTRLPAAASFWELAEIEGRDEALTAVEELSRLSAAEIRDLGITLNLAPVAEVLSDDNSAFLETRSYGPDPDFTEAAASSFIRGMDALGVACAVKHFPGNSQGDPHDGEVALDVDRDALDRIIRPFAGIIRTLRPAALIVSHVKVPVLDPLRSSSLSPVVMDWLREDLGFTGIIVADDFSMGAVAASGTSPGDAAVEALISGADMVMVWPLDIAAVYEAILNALEENRLPRSRLREAAEHILAEKLRYGLAVDAAGDIL
ncbi:MAG: glycoside hydrolase family 3 protein [Treponema sp.]|jgi:beta-N-acetylhexosaminidase|nr:glycoside hydrolase family 3 protein [Treponema sp.]